MKELIKLKEPLGIIKNAKDIFKRIQKFNIDFNQENIIIFILNTNGKVIFFENLFKGGTNSCEIDTKTIFRKVLLKGGCKLIISHNHPSSYLKPSYEDRESFGKLKEIGELIGIQVLDSIIFNKKEFYSIQEDN